MSFFAFPRCQVNHPLSSQSHLQEINLISTFKENRGCCSWKGQNPEQPEGSRIFEKEKVGQRLFDFALFE